MAGDGLVLENPSYVSSTLEATFFGNMCGSLEICVGPDKVGGGMVLEDLMVCIEICQYESCA